MAPLWLRPLCRLSACVVLLALTACDSGDGDDGPDLTGTWVFTAPEDLTDLPFYLRITASGDGFAVETWTYYEAPDACYYQDQGEAARLTHVSGDRWRSETGGDVEEVRIAVSDSQMTVRNAGLTVTFTRTAQALEPACDGQPDGHGGGSWVGTVTATVDGHPYRADEFISYWKIGTEVSLASSATDSSGSQRHLAINLLSVSVPGTYALTGEARTGQWVEDDGSEVEVFTTQLAGADAGTITFTELSEERSSGTFAFTGKSAQGGTRTVSAGAFELRRVR